MINTANHELDDTIPVGHNPSAVTYNSDNGELYVTNSGDNTVSGIEGANTISETVPNLNFQKWHLVDTLPVGTAPSAIVYDSDGSNKVYIANHGSNTVSVIVTDTHPSATRIFTVGDGSDHGVDNGSDSNSNQLSFNIFAQANLYPLAGFQCSLNFEPFKTCENQIIYTPESGNVELDLDQYSVKQENYFSLRAVDTHGNVDPLSATFWWYRDLSSSQSPSPSNNSTILGNGNLLRGFNNHGGNSIAITGSSDGGNGILNGIGGSGGHSGSATATGGNVVNGNENRWNMGGDNNP